jgi:hypothetical protein
MSDLNNIFSQPEGRSDNNELNSEKERTSAEKEKEEEEEEEEFEKEEEEEEEKNDTSFNEFMKMLRETDKNTKDFAKLNIYHRQHFYPVMMWNNRAPVAIRNNCLIGGPSFKIMLPNNLVVDSSTKKGNIQITHLNHFNEFIPINEMKSFLMDKKCAHCNKDTNSTCKKCGIYYCSSECQKNNFDKHKEHCVCYYFFFLFINVF